MIYTIDSIYSVPEYILSISITNRMSTNLGTNSVSTDVNISTHVIKSGLIRLSEAYYSSVGSEQ